MSTLVQVKLRIRESLRREFERRAKMSGRSLSGEIVWFIDTALEAGDWRQRIEEVTQKLEDRVNGKSPAMPARPFPKPWL